MMNKKTHTSKTEYIAPIIEVEELVKQDILTESPLDNGDVDALSSLFNSHSDAFDGFTIFTE